MSVVLATAGYDHTIRFWEASNGICVRTLQHPDSQVNRIAITSNKQFLAAAGNPSVRLFEVATQGGSSQLSSAATSTPATPSAPVYTFDGHTTNVTAVGFQRDSKWMFTGSEDKTVKVWDLRGGSRCHREYKCPAPVNSVVLHPNQGELISCDRDGNLMVWDLVANKLVAKRRPGKASAAGQQSLLSLSISPDSSLLVAASASGVCHMFAPKPSAMGSAADESDGGATEGSYASLGSFEAHPGHFVLQCRISPDGQCLATTSSDHTVRIWSLAPMDASGRWVDSGAAEGEGGVEGSEAPPLPPAATHKGSRAGASLNVECKKTLVVHDKWVWDCAFSADSSYLVTASSDTSARVRSFRCALLPRRCSSRARVRARWQRDGRYKQKNSFVCILLFVFFCLCRPNEHTVRVRRVLTRAHSSPPFPFPFPCPLRALARSCGTSQAAKLCAT
jgi:G protein beta subunit-like protein